MWVDRDGNEEALPAPHAIPGSIRAIPRISNDGRRVVATYSDGTRAPDLWIYDLETGTSSRLPFHAGADLNSAWRSDDHSIVFASVRDGTGFSLWEKPADGSGQAVRLPIDGSASGFISVVPGSAHVLFSRVVEENLFDDFLFSPDSEPQVRSLIASSKLESAAAVSPDGRWIAHQSGEQVLVHPFPDVDSATWQTGPPGARFPTWSRSSNEIFLQTRSGILSTSYDSDPTFRPGTTRLLLSNEHVIDTSTMREWDVTPDGSRFLVTKLPAAG